MTEPKLKNRNILLVEDDYYQARDTRDWLESAGAHVVGPTAHAEDVIALLDDGVDVAIVDINLGRGPSFELAETLIKRDVPIVFVTGYDAEVIPSELAHFPRLQKPVNEADVVRAVATLCDSQT